MLQIEINESDVDEDGEINIQLQVCSDDPALIARVRRAIRMIMVTEEPAKISFVKE